VGAGRAAGDQLVGPQAARHTVSNTNDLVTGRLAGADAGTHDIDGGVTSIRSPLTALPSTGTLTLSLSYYLAHGSTSSSAGFFRVSIVHSGGTTPVFTGTGAASDVDAAWTVVNANLTLYAGQSIRILIEAADAAGASLVEAAVGDVTIIQTDRPPPIAAPSLLAGARGAVALTHTGIYGY
jgi:hypothetical protein